MPRRRYLCRADRAARRRSICRAATAAVPASLLCALPQITTFRSPPPARRSSLCAAARATAFTRPHAALCLPLPPPAALDGIALVPSASRGRWPNYPGRVAPFVAFASGLFGVLSHASIQDAFPLAVHRQRAAARPRSERFAHFALMVGRLTAHPAPGFASAGEPPHADDLRILALSHVIPPPLQFSIPPLLQFSIPPFLLAHPLPIHPSILPLFQSSAFMFTQFFIPPPARVCHPHTHTGAYAHLCPPTHSARAVRCADQSRGLVQPDCCGLPKSACTPAVRIHGRDRAQRTTTTINAQHSRRAARCQIPHWLQPTSRRRP